MLRTSQVIRLAMIVGLLLAGGVMGFMGFSSPLQGPGGAPSGGGGWDIFAVLVPVVGIVGIGVACAAPIAWKRSARAAWDSRADDDAAFGRVLAGYQSLTVVQGALLEAPGLFGAVAALLTGNVLMLLAPAACVVLLAVLFPRANLLSRWIEETTGESDEEADKAENA